MAQPSTDLWNIVSFCTIEKKSGKLVEDGGVSLVPSSWLVNNDKCLWPPGNSKVKIDEHIKLLNSPQKNWKEHHVRVMKKGICDYNRGKHITALFEEHSDVNTDMDEQKEAGLPGKRKRKPNKKYAEEDDEDNDEDSDSENRPPFRRQEKKTKTPPLPLPPPRPVSVQDSHLSPSNSDMTFYDENIYVRDMGVVIPDSDEMTQYSPLLSVSREPLINNCPQDFYSCELSAIPHMPRSDPATKTGEQVTCKTDKKKQNGSLLLPEKPDHPASASQSILNLNPIVGNLPTESLCTHPTKQSYFSREWPQSDPLGSDTSEQLGAIMRMLVYLKHAVEENGANIKRLLDSDTQKGESTETSPVLPVFPCQTKDELLLLETNLLKNEANQKLMATELSLLGGSTLHDIVVRMLRRIFSDSVAKLYSWQGRKGKLKFSSLIVHKVVCNAVRIRLPRNPPISEKEVEGEGSNWLAQASFRARGSGKSTEISAVSVGETSVESITPMEEGQPK